MTKPIEPAFEEPRIDSKRMMIGVAIALVAARVYYAWIMQVGPQLQVWFAVSPGKAFAILIPAGIVGAYVGGWGARRWLGARLILPCAILGGAISTAMVNGLIGAMLGAVTGATMASNRAQAAWRVTLSTLATTVVLAIVPITGGALADNLGQQPHVTRSAAGGATLLATAVVAISLQIGWRRRKAGDESSGVRWYKSLQWLVILPLVALELRVGVELQRGWQIRCLNRVGRVSMEMPYGLSWKLVTGQQHFVSAGHTQLFRHASNRDLARLRYFSDSIDSIFLEKTKITTEAFANTVRLPNATWAWIVDEAIDDRGVKHLLPSNRVSVLSLRRTQISDQLLPHIAKWPMQSLHITGIQRTTADSFRQLSACRTLDWLELQHVQLTDSEAIPLGTLPIVRHLSVANNQLSGEFLASFAGSQTLNSVNLSDNPLDTKHLVHLIRSNLMWFDLDGVPIGTAGWRAISNLRSLQHLSIRRSGDRGRHLASMIGLFPDLQELRIDASQLDANAIRLPISSVNLHLSNQSLTAAHIQRLTTLATMTEQTRGTQSQISLESCQLDGSAVAELINSPLRMYTLIQCKYETRFALPLQAHAVIRP